MGKNFQEQFIYKKFYTSRDELHRHFSGYIYLADFNTNYCNSDNSYGSNIAERIISDWKFDSYCLNKQRSKGENDVL